MSIIVEATSSNTNTHAVFDKVFSAIIQIIAENTLNLHILNCMSRIDDLIIEIAGKQQTITINEAYQYCLMNCECKKSYIEKRLTLMVSRGKLARTGRGIYSFIDKIDKASFHPFITEDIKTLCNSIKAKYPFTNFCIYEGTWISPLLHHLASNQTIYVEVERNASEFVFDYLRSRNINVYYRPDEDMIYKYIDLNERNIFVKNLVSESPLQKIDEIPIPSLEKLLVDIYCDPDFYYLQDNEYHRIAENATTIYTINRTKMLRYAQRRGTKEELERIFNDI